MALWHAQVVVRGWCVWPCECVGVWGGVVRVWCGFVVYRCHEGACGPHGCVRVGCACGCGSAETEAERDSQAKDNAVCVWGCGCGVKGDDRQGSMACCSPHGCKESDMTE